MPKGPIKHSVEIRGVDNGFIVRHTADQQGGPYKSTEHVAANSDEALGHVKRMLGKSKGKR